MLSRSNLALISFESTCVALPWHVESADGATAGIHTLRGFLKDFLDRNNGLLDLSFPNVCRLLSMVHSVGSMIEQYGSAQDFFEGCFAKMVDQFFDSREYLACHPREYLRQFLDIGHPVGSVDNALVLPWEDDEEAYRWIREASDGWCTLHSSIDGAEHAASRHLVLSWANSCRHGNRILFRLELKSFDPVQRCGAGEPNGIPESQRQPFHAMRINIVVRTSIHCLTSPSKGNFNHHHPPTPAQTFRHPTSHTIHFRRRSFVCIGLECVFGAHVTKNFDFVEGNVDLTLHHGVRTDCIFGLLPQRLNGGAGRRS